jgi:nitroreductase
MVGGSTVIQFNNGHLRHLNHYCVKQTRGFMDIIEAVLMRKSIRGFKPDPIPKEVLNKIIEAAVRAPSSDNSQPWEIYILRGEPLDRIRADNIIAMESGEDGREYPPYEPVYRKRQVDLAIQLFTLMGIGREDKEKRIDWMRRGYRFFDAPVGIVLSADKSLDIVTAASDVGGLAQTICLLALAYGLGSCILVQSISYEDIVRKHAGIPESENLLLSIALGYPDDNFPANNVKSARDPIDVNASWLGFD